MNYGTGAGDVAIGHMLNAQDVIQQEIIFVILATKQYVLIFSRLSLCGFACSFKFTKVS